MRKQSLAELLFEEESKASKVYPLEELALYSLESQGMLIYSLADPDLNFVGMVGIKEAAKPCNFATQIKFVAVESRYQGKGVGGYLYRLAAAVSQQGGNKSGITSDHTDSSTILDKNVWDKMVPAKFDIVEPKKGNAKFDYTGKDTPDVETDDCTLPSGSAPATDYAWELKSSEVSKAFSMSKVQIQNAKKYGDLSNAEIYDKTYDLFSANYNPNVGMAESTFHRWGQLANILGD